MTADLQALLGVFQRWLHLPDPGPVLVTLGAYAANLMTGDPVWLLLVGPPGSGKTEILQSLAGEKAVRLVGTITEAGLLSGSPRKERPRGAKGGLLREIGKFGVVALKDFTSILSMHREGRQRLLAAFREIFDGSWVRILGSDGGLVLPWSGKLGLLGGVTETIDRHHEVMSTMGERFVLYRMPELDPQEVARQALRADEQSPAMRRELQQAVSRFLKRCKVSRKPIPACQEEWLVHLALLVARARSAVERDGYSREIELVASTEVPGRIAKSLGRLHAGLRAIGVGEALARDLACKVGFDSLPAARRRLIESLAQAEGPVGLGQLAGHIRLPKTVTRRHLEDLQAHGVVEAQRCGNEDRWHVTNWTRDRLRALGTVPEMSAVLQPIATEPEASTVPDLSGALYIPPSTKDDISGTEDEEAAAC